jgi:PhzF family phenazine biosynthesis protein
MEFPLYHIDTFTKQVFAGNPAAVCLLPSWLPDEKLQAIAAENYLPDTSFVIEKEDKYEIRWFSPSKEIDLCGHGTLAAAYVLLRWVKPWLNAITFQSQTDLLTVTRENDHFVMDFPARLVAPCDLLPGIDQALGAIPRQFLKGPWWYIAVIESEKQVRQLKPDLTKLAELGCEKIIVTAPGDRVDFVSRYFKTQETIHEDPVTGATHCSLMPYWGRRLGKSKLQAKQVSARSGELECEWRQDRVLIKGSAVAYLQGTITVPNV